jgi:hypothetical protein
MRGQRSQSRCLRDSPRQSPSASASQSACPSRPQISITCNTSTISFGSRVRQTFLPPNELSVRRFLVLVLLDRIWICPFTTLPKHFRTQAHVYGCALVPRRAQPCFPGSVAIQGGFPGTLRQRWLLFFWIRPVRVCWPPERSLFETL